MDATILQDMADSGLSRAAIAALYGMSKPNIDRYMRSLAITTNGHRKTDEIHGTQGKQPAKLMPSSDALRAVSVFSLGRDVHASTVFRSPD